MLNFVAMNNDFFNFSHDLALSHNCFRYTPPPNVRLMERDLAPLTQLLPQCELEYSHCAPVWGWDRSFVTILREKGIKNLPSDTQLQEIRNLSSRKTAVEILEELRATLPYTLFAGHSIFLTDIDQLSALMLHKDVDTTNPHIVLKEALSGSGRGLRFIKEQPTSHQRNWAIRCIKQQGGVVAEPYYNKVRDFALEFIVSENDLTYTGLSLFHTNENNVYAGNIIAPQQQLWAELYKYIPSQTFDNLIDSVTTSLKQRFIGHYLGPLGVDMMIILHQDKYKIHPCVEINVRRTMGELSLHLLPFLAPGVTAIFSLEFNKHTPIPIPPPAIYNDDGLLLEGTKLLTPITDDTHYVATLKTIKRCSIY